MTPPKVSICIPVHNGGAYFRMAVESALAQDYPNVEVVVVDDGSRDDGETDRVARSYGNRITYVHQENRGVAGALNTALRHMTGDHFAWLSHDDLHHPDKTSAQMAFLARLGRPDACVISDFRLIDPEGAEIEVARLPVERIRSNPRLPLYQGQINGCTLLIPAWIMRRYGPFDETLRTTQDYDLWNRILADHEFFHLPEILVSYRLHPGQDSHKPLAATEGDALWRRMLDSRTETERAQMFGSTRLYFERLGEFLDRTPYKEAARHARTRLAALSPLVSVVIPFRRNAPLARRAAESVLGQDGARAEVILVNDSLAADGAPLRPLVEADDRVTLIHQPGQPGAGPAAARNRGMRAARGDYLAFLDADGVFRPGKLARQLDLMQRQGALFSHTSYHVAPADPAEGPDLVRSGSLTGACYPRIIADCPIETSTVVLHRSVADAGFEFPTEPDADERMLWFDLAARYLLLGLDEPLSVVDRSGHRAAEARARALAPLLRALDAHPLHRGQTPQLEELRRASRDPARTADRGAAERAAGDVARAAPMGTAPMGTAPAIPPAGHGIPPEALGLAPPVQPTAAHRALGIPHS